MKRLLRHNHNYQCAIIHAAKHKHTSPPKYTPSVRFQKRSSAINNNAPQPKNGHSAMTIEQRSHDYPPTFHITLSLHTRTHTHMLSELNDVFIAPTQPSCVLSWLYSLSHSLSQTIMLATNDSPEPYKIVLAWNRNSIERPFCRRQQGRPLCAPLSFRPSYLTIQLQSQTNTHSHTCVTHIISRIWNTHMKA